MNDVPDPIPAGEHQAAVAQARADGAAEATARIRAILTCENAAGREVAAIDMALDEETTFSAVSANKMLGHMPKQDAAAPAALAPAQQQIIPTVEQRSAGPEIGSACDFSVSASTNNPIAQIIRRSAGKE